MRNKKTNPFYKKLSSSLKQKGLNISIQNAYFLFGIPYTATSVDEIKEAIAYDKLTELKKAIPYNVAF